MYLQEYFNFPHQYNHVMLFGEVGSPSTYYLHPAATTIGMIFLDYKTLIFFPICMNSNEAARQCYVSPSMHVMLLCTWFAATILQGSGCNHQMMYAV